MIVFVVLILSAVWQPGNAIAAGKYRCQYWVAPSPFGNDENPGTIDFPWASLEYASNHVRDDHCIVWFYPGVYQGGNRINRRFETHTAFVSIKPYQAIMENNGAVLFISGGKNITMEGFNIRHSGPGARALVVAIDRSQLGWAENIILRNNMIHDSYNDDLLKIYNGCKDIVVENNLFFNQGDSEEHMDVNSVVNVTIQENIFFNDFESSGRPNNNMSKQYIVIKDSNGTDDGLVGSKQVYVRGNVLLNWQGQKRETFIQVGLDGKPYIEAEDVHIENNLILGNSSYQIGAPFGVRGARDVYFINNTVVGDLPSKAYAFRVTITEQNPRNENIYFVNNIWADPTGTMGADTEGGENEFSDGDLSETENLVLLNNLYWNGGVEIPGGDLLSPLQADNQFIIQDPRLDTNYDDLVLPVWEGSQFRSGELTIRQEFLRLVTRYGSVPSFSPAIDLADLSYAPLDDILGNPRFAFSDIGAFEFLEPTNQPVKRIKEFQIYQYGR